MALAREMERVMRLMATKPLDVWPKSSLGHTNTRLALCKRGWVEFDRVQEAGSGGQFVYRLTWKGRAMAASLIEDSGKRVDRRPLGHVEYEEAEPRPE